MNHVDRISQAQENRGELMNLPVALVACPSLVAIFQEKTAVITGNEDIAFGASVWCEGSDATTELIVLVEVVLRRSLDVSGEADQRRAHGRFVKKRFH